MSNETKPVLTLHVGRYEVTAPYEATVVDLPPGRELGVSYDDSGGSSSKPRSRSS